MRFSVGTWEEVFFSHRDFVEAAEQHDAFSVIEHFWIIIVKPLDENTNSSNTMRPIKIVCRVLENMFRVIVEQVLQ